VALSPAEHAEAKRIADILEFRGHYKFRVLFPDEDRLFDPLRAPKWLPAGLNIVHAREKYPRSLIFFAAGLFNRERLFLAANRTSKTVSAAYESAAHATGDYPDWWPGRRFGTPIEMWTAGDTRETTRDIIQLELFGTREEVRNGTYATGMVPAHTVLDRTLKTGVADCIDTAWVRWGRETHHGAPFTTTVQFKSYDQGRVSFQGTSKHLIWLDEEPPDAKDEPSGGGTPSGNGDIYTECLLRTATTDGLVIATFTPLRGLTLFVEYYLETGQMVDAAGNVVNGKIGIFGKDAAA
jgi:phage terminase large subunit-like protein